MYTHSRNVWKELPLTVEFSYQPAEPAETGPEAQYPGCAESFDIEGIYFGRVEITNELTDAEREEILVQLIDNFNYERANP